MPTCDGDISAPARIISFHCKVHYLFDVFTLLGVEL